MSNGEDDEGNHGVTQCEIDIETGKAHAKQDHLDGVQATRFESPHLYKNKGRILPYGG